MIDKDFLGGFPKFFHVITVTSIWLIVFLSYIVLKSTGVLLPVLQTQFATYTRNIGVIVSVFVSGNIVAIFSQRLTRIIDARTTIILCAILSSTGLMVSSLASNMTVLVLGMGLAGFSCMTNVLALGVIPHYFSTNYNVVTNIVTTALPIAIMVSTPLTQLFIDLYGWRGCLVMISGLTMNIIPCAALLRPPQQSLPGYKSIDSTQSKDDGIGRTDLSQILKDFTSGNFVLLYVLSFIAGFDLNGWLVYLVSFIQSKGVLPSEAARIASYSGVGCLVVRVILALTQGKSKNYRLLFIMSSLLLVTSYGGMYLTSPNVHLSWILLSLCSVVLGSGHGILGSQIYNAAASVSISNGNTVIAIAIVQLIASIAYLISGYVSGWLFDLDGSFQPTFILQGSMSSMVLVAVAVEYMCSWFASNQSSKLCPMIPCLGVVTE